MVKSFDKRGMAQKKKNLKTEIRIYNPPASLLKKLKRIAKIEKRAYCSEIALFLLEGAVFDYLSVNDAEKP